MKKTKYLLMGLLISVLAITGCSKKNKLSVEETFKKAVDNVNSAENFKMNMAMNVGIKGEGLTMDMSIKLDSINDIKNGTNKMTMSMSVFGINKEAEMYIDSKSESGKVITYTKDTEGNWSKTVEDANANDDTDASIEFLKNLDKNNGIKQLKADKNNYNYEVTINAETLKSLMSQMNNEDTNDYADVLKGDMKLNVSIDKKTYNYSKISMDMTDMMKKSMGEVQEGVEVTKAEFIINFSDYNNAGTVTIPEDVINSAKDENNSISSNTSFDEDDYDQVLSCSFSSTEDEYSADMNVVYGFVDDKSIMGAYVATYSFDSEEAAQAFYDEYEAEENEEISIDGSNIVVSDEEEFDEYDQMGYNEAKEELVSVGFTCN